VALDPFPLPTVSDVGLIVNMQPDAWFTVNVCPPMVSVPVRAGPELAAMLKLVVPLPVPEPPDVIVTKEGALFVTVQAQLPALAVMFVLLDVAPVPTDTEFGLNENVQPDAWLTVKV
jgi:hypothetical protein